MKKVRLISIMLILVLSLGLLAACNGDTDSTDPTPAPANGEETTPPDDNGEEATPPPETGDWAGDPRFAERVVISTSVMDSHIVGRAWEDDTEWSPLMVYLMETFNFEFDFFPLDWGDMIDVTRMWMATGTAPDVMFLDVATVRYGEFYQNATQDGFFRAYDLDAFPGLRAAFEEMPPAAHEFMINGQLWAWPGVLDGAANRPYAFNGVVYRADWAGELGLGGQDIYTHDEFFDMMRQVQEARPGTIGISSNNWMMPRDWSVGQMATGITNFVRQADGTYTWGPFMDSSAEVVRIMNELYNEGLIWPEQVTDADGPMWEDLFDANQLFAMVRHNILPFSITDTVERWVEGNGFDHEDDAVITYHMENTLNFAIVEAPDGSLTATQGAGIWSQTAMSSQISDANAERFQAILEWMVSEVGTYTRAFGMQGTDWDFDASGNFQLMWEEDEDGNLVDAAFGRHANWPITRMASNLDSRLDIHMPELINDAVMARFTALAAIVDGPRFNRVPFDAALGYFTGELFMEVGVREWDIYTQIAALLPAPPGAVEDLWTQWVDAQRPQMQPIVDEINAAIG